MKLNSKVTRFFLMLCLGLFIGSGCSDNMNRELLDETSDPIYRRAKDLADRGMKNEALENYLKLIQKRNGDAPESHLDAGVIYLNHLRDPETALYYFKRYKALARSSGGSSDERKRLDLVDDLIKTARKEFVANLDLKVYQDPLERLKLLDTIENLRKENEVLKTQLMDARTRLNERPTVAAVQSEPIPSGDAEVAARDAAPAQRFPVTPPPAQEVRRYTIKSGDSLYKISRQVYGESSRWKEILEANRDVIPDPGNLKVGTSIVIP